MPSSVTEASYSLLNIIDMVPTSNKLLVPNETLSWAMSGKPSSTYLSDYINGTERMTSIGFYPKKQAQQTKILIQKILMILLTIPIILMIIEPSIDYFSSIQTLIIIFILLTLMISRLCLLSMELKKLQVPLGAIKRLQASINDKLFQSKNIIKEMMPIIRTAAAIETALRIQKKIHISAIIGSTMTIISLLSIIAILGLSITSIINECTQSILKITSTLLTGLSIIWHLGYGLVLCVRSISKKNTCALIKKSLTDLAKARHENFY
ncbi:hypothetical protein CLAVI_000428 [Candidatus Clavichlamydia salmonicola]|uniref:hypothetical protein n=1 Tax=Candidatus Clavichlamydia salmonicola TaxID=469812 RepID=UPI001891C098|nr:hypothetical protein [Candidatus Clavichlamydia salmonicola]MBF5050809.1 hypothetical protein [Candidatus Clavichlamydia salmonicola]